MQQKNKINQALYAHMNNKRKMKKKKNRPRGKNGRKTQITWNLIPFVSTGQRKASNSCASRSH
jgi:hypothetical protein